MSIHLVAWNKKLPQSLKRFWVPITLIIASFAFVFSNVAQHSEAFSPLDEWVYFDYVTKVPSQGFVHVGEAIGAEALYRMSCFGDADGPSGMPCNGPNGTYNDPSEYSFKGITSAAGYTPAYFWATWGVANTVSSVTGIDFFKVARATGAIWLSAGMLFLFLAFTRLKIPQLVSLGIGLGILALPNSYYAFTFITTDAPTFFWGSLVIFLAIKFIQEGKGATLLLCASAIGFIFKGTLIFVIAFVIALLIVSLNTQFRGKSGISTKLKVVPTVLVAIGMFLFTLFWNSAWANFVSANAVGNSPDQGGEVPLTPRPFLDGLFAFIPDLTGGKSQNLMDYTSAPMALLIIAGLIGFLLVSKGLSFERIFGLTTIACAILLVPAFVTLYFLQSGYTVPIEPRYGIALTTALVAPVGLLPNSKIGIQIILGIGILSAVIAISGVVQP